MRSVKDTFLWLAEKFRQIVPGPSLKALLIPKNFECEIDLEFIFSIDKDTLTRLGVKESWRFTNSSHFSKLDDSKPFGDFVPRWFHVFPSKRPNPDAAFFIRTLYLPSALFKHERRKEETDEKEGEDISSTALIFVENWTPAFEAIAGRGADEAFKDDLPFRAMFENWLELLISSYFGSPRYWEAVTSDGYFWNALEWLIFLQSHPEKVLEYKTALSLDDIPPVPCPIFTHIFDAALLSEEICLQIAKDGYIAENIWEQMESPAEENPEKKDFGPLLPIMQEQNGRRRTSSTRGDWVLKALEKVMQYPEAEDQDIAKMIGKDKSLLSRNKRYRLMAQRIRDMIQTQRAKRMRGIISKNRCGKSTADRVVPFQLPDEDGQLENIPETVWDSGGEDQEEESQTI